MKRKNKWSFVGKGIGGGGGWRLVDDLPRAPFSLATPLYVNVLFFVFCLRILSKLSHLR